MKKTANTQNNNHIRSPLTPEIPNKDSMAFAANLLRQFGDLVLVDTKNERIASTKENPQLFNLFKDVLFAISQGKAVSVVPYDAILTTHQAAKFLNVSRPFLIGLLEKDEIPYHLVGTHRRVRFEDVLAYKNKMNEDSDVAHKELIQLSEEYGLY